MRRRKLRGIMKALSFILQTLPVLIGLVTTSGAGHLFAIEAASQSTIPRVERMPNLPQPFAMRNWSPGDARLYRPPARLRSAWRSSAARPLAGRKPNDGFDAGVMSAAARSGGDQLSWRQSSAARLSDWTCGVIAVKTG